jgi:hypothetical protein
MSDMKMRRISHIKAEADKIAAWVAQRDDKPDHELIILAMVMLFVGAFKLGSDKISMLGVIEQFWELCVAPERAGEDKKEMH